MLFYPYPWMEGVDGVASGYTPNCLHIFFKRIRPLWFSYKDISKKKSIEQEYKGEGLFLIPADYMTRCGDPSHLIGDCPKTSCNKDQKAFIGGSWSDSENDAEDKTNDETCLMAQSSNEVTLNSSCYSDNTSSLDNDNMQIEYDILCEISLKIINKNKILKTKRDLLEKEILELNEKIKKLEKSKEIQMACKSCNELKLENAKLKETQVKFFKFDKSADSLREMLNNQKSPSCKIGLGFNSDKASTSKTKTMCFVGSSAKKVTDGSTIKGHESTLLGSVCLRTCLEPDEWIKDSGCSKHMTGNKSLFSTYKAYDGGVFLGYSQSSKAYVVLNKHTMKVEESHSVTFNESPPPTILSSLVDDDFGEEDAIRKNTKTVNTNNEEDESIEVEEIVNIKESKNHPLDQVIGNLNQRILRSQAQNHFPLPLSQSVIETKWVFRNKLDENGIVSRNKAILVAQGYNQQEGTDYDETYATIARLESIRILFAIACANDFKLYQMDVKSDFLNGFINEDVYVSQPLGFIDFQKPNYVHKLKKALYGLKQLLKLETEVYANFDTAGDYVDRKSTSGVCTFMGCCLTSWFAKKQTAIAIFTTEAEYVSVGKACQQALWMKQALNDYDIRLDNVPIMFDNKGAIDLKKVASEDNIADIFTKPLKHKVFNYLRLGLGMMELIMDSDPSSSQK
nr:retrovirus-related Pol polyprotein from transposon TNT 1-94 [Tanacetum cinerariifolium]